MNGDRIKTLLKKGTTDELTRYYRAGQYEIDKGVAGNKERLYLGGDAYSAAAVYVKEGTTWSIHYILRDYLGSITHLTDAVGTLKQELSYDPWGRLRNPVNQALYEVGTEPTLILGRGYTGHEHLAHYGLINMNARLYDPVVGRFLSPDPYVQAMFMSQNFNRYSYALNNPLRFTDPSGEFLWIAFIVGAVIGGYIGGALANGNLNPIDWDWSSGKTWGYMLGGAAIGGLSGYAGGAVAASGVPMANTLGIVTSSFTSSYINFIMTGGKTDISMSVGIASFDFTNGKFGFLGKKGNRWYEDLAYSFGAIANSIDLVSLGTGGGQNISVNSAKTKDGESWWGHSSITGKNGNNLVSVGPTRDVGKAPSIGGTFKNSMTPADVNYATYYNDPGTWKVTLNNVSRKMMPGYSGRVSRWDLLLNSCVGHTSKSLWMSGVPEYLSISSTYA